MADQTEGSFEGWAMSAQSDRRAVAEDAAIAEFMGHRKLGGYIKEQAIALKLSSLTTNQLALVAFDINAIIAGVELTSHRHFECIKQRERLDSMVKRLEEDRSLLKERVKELKHSHVRIQRQLLQLKNIPSGN